MIVNELEGPLLDCWVARAEGKDALLDESFVMIKPDYWVFNPSRAWGLGGPIIARERIDFEHLDTFDAPNPDIRATLYTANGKFEAVGKTMLVAAMRCFVASRFGQEVTIDD